MSECLVHEKLRRQGSLCPFCRIVELESIIEEREAQIESFEEDWDALEEFRSE